MDCAISVKEIIDREANHYCSAFTFSVQFGISEIKLKEAFKYLYKISISAYQLDKRMLFARTMLEEGGLFSINIQFLI